ncbi:MAG: peptidoglycan bridge formation glycyltransferase FemA/FemB family protein [Chloroflexota bacterium]
MAEKFVMEEAVLEGRAWNEAIADLPGAHILQTWEWGQFKAQYGWDALPYVWREADGKLAAASLILRRSIPIGGLAARLRILYVPKGPLCDWSQAELRRRVLNDLAELARQQGAIFIKIDPDVRLGSGLPGQEGAQDDATGRAVVADLEAAHWRFSQEQVQFRNTVLIDLAAEPEDLLANMKQKTRYNVRLAERKGVRVRLGGLDELGLLYQMYAETSLRDGFAIRDEAYYRSVWGNFMQAGMAEALIAEVQGEVVAGLMLFHFAGKAWYLYGMSRQAHREKMPNYLLQWEAMRRARASGCGVYDLWGAPDALDEDDPLWGVYRFKEGLGGSVVRYLGAWDLPARGVYYRIYTQVLPRLLDVMRQRGKARTRRSMVSV